MQFYDTSSVRIISVAFVNSRKEGMRFVFDWKMKQLMNVIE